MAPQRTQAEAAAECLRHQLLDHSSRACACEGGVTPEESLLASAQSGVGEATVDDQPTPTEVIPVS